MSPQTEEYEQIRQDTLISMVKVVVNIGWLHLELE